MNSFSYFELKEKSNSYEPSNFVDELGFKETLNIARQMLNNEEWDEDLQSYAVNLLEELKQKYSEEWNSNWKYDAFLGYAYDIILKYDERYSSYKRAFDKVHSQPPPQLLVALAGCCWTPGYPPITEEDAILLVKQATANEMYVEAVELLRGLYKSIGNIEEQQYWEAILENIKYTGKHLPSLDSI